MTQINITLEQPPQLGQTPELRSGTKWLNRLWILLNDIKSITNTVTGIDSTLNARIDGLDSAKAGINDAEVISGLWDFSTLPTLEADPTGSTQAVRKGYVDGVIHTRKHAIDSALDHDAISGLSGSVAILSSSGFIIDSDTLLSDLLRKVFSPIYYDDLFVDIAPRTTGVGKPTLSAFSGNIQKYTFAVNDISELSAIELKHDWKEGSEIEIHVHWCTNGANDATVRGVKWEIDYTWANNLEVGNYTAFPSATTLSSETSIAENEPDKTHKYTSVLSFTPTGGKIGACLCISLKRIASVTNTAPANNPFVIMVGVHYQIDTIGSLSISSKT